MESRTCLYSPDAFNVKFGTKRNEFTAVHFNIRSMKHKGEALDTLLASMRTEFDVLLFSETWLKMHEDHLHIDKYKYNGLIRSHGRGGGLAVYVKQCYEHSVLDQFTVMDQNIECLAVSLSNIVVVLVYRPPTGKKSYFFEFLENCLGHLHSLKQHFVIMGDININLMVDNSDATNFNSIVLSYGCSSLISLPTRITSNSATLLDICVTNVMSDNVESGRLCSDLSDHLPIFCFLPVSNKSVRHKDSYKYRNINEVTLNKFKALVDEISWDSIYSTSDVNEAYHQFFIRFSTCYNAAFPLIEKKMPD